MIPILYESDESAFVSNGICRLVDCLTCVVTEERNGIYECDFDYPVNGAHYDQIQCGRIIGCKHDDTNDVQPFDIVSYSRPINGVVSFHAVHISYRQTGLVAKGKNVNSLSAAFAMLRNSTPSNPFTYEADFTSANYLASADGVPRSVRQFLGGVEGSILDAYGGEFEFDKFNVKLWRNRGTRKDFVIRYGLNLVDYNETADYSGTYTSAIPYWTGDDGAGGRASVVGAQVDSGLASYNGRDICAAIDLTDKFSEKPTATQLQTFIRSQMQSQSPNIPTQNINIDFVRLQDSTEFSNVANLLECSLCDSVRVEFPRYNMQGTFKIVKTVYNVLADRFDRMELGDLSSSLSEALGIQKSGLSQEKEGTAVEYGRNSNGQYWKFPDGLLICGRTWTGTVTMATAWGSHYETASAIKFGNWAYSFADLPFISALCEGGTAFAILERLTGQTNSAIGSGYLMSPTSRSNVTVSFDFIGIGRWK